MATNFSPSSGSYILNKFPSISQWSDTGPSWPSCFLYSRKPFEANMKIATGIVCAVHILSIVVVNSSFVSKYSKPSRATKRCKVNFVMEKFVSGFCKKGDRDLTLYSITASQCIQECRARTECKSINMFTRVNICKINFESNLTLEKCKYYFHSDKANWTQVGYLLLDTNFVTWRQAFL